MKLLLVNPSWDGLVSRRGRRYNRAWPPIDLLAGAALAERDGHTVRLIDVRATPASVADVRRAGEWADLAVITSSPLDRWQCPNLDLDLFRAFTRQLPADRLFVCGAHGTAYPEHLMTLTGARGVLRGDPEPGIRDLARGMPLAEVPGLVWHADGRAVRNAEPPPVELDALPTPAWHLVDLRHYRYELLGGHFALLEASRGCPFSCAYCSLLMYGRKVRFRHPGQVARDVQAAVQAGARCGYFIDLEFTVNRKWVLQVCNAIRRTGVTFTWAAQTRADTVDPDLLDAMHAAGCRLLHFGVESGAPEILRAIGKRMDLAAVEQGVRWARDAGIETACFFMVGLPGETEAQMEQTIAFARRLNPDYASFHIATPYPGAPWYPVAETSPAVAYAESCPGALPLPVLRRMARRGVRRFYLRPAYLRSRLRHGSPAGWLRQARLFLGFART